MKYKGIIIGSAVIMLIITVLVCVIIILSRKKQAETIPLPAETDWGKALSDSESATIKRIADALHDDMNGLNLFNRNHAIYVEYNNTSDRIFVGVANYFAQVYGNGETLAQWIKGEGYSWLSFQTEGVADAIIARLSQNGIN
jgi:hypothetical protein